MALGRPAPRVDWRRARAIFGDPPPPPRVTEEQFDGFHDVLARLAQTHWTSIDAGDLWYYHHDLAYVDLQPDLFAYLFPVCLMDWQRTLLANVACSHGDSEFHYGLHRGNVLARMLRPAQRVAVVDFLHDGMLDRLDADVGLEEARHGCSAHGGYRRMNSLGKVVPLVGRLWDSWHDFRTTGKAAAWIAYASGLVYAETEENPIFGRWTPSAGGGGPYLWEDDSHLYDVGWLPENLVALRERLTPDRVVALTQSAVARLRGDPGLPRAEQVAEALSERRERVAWRCERLPHLLAGTQTVVRWGDE